MQVDSGIMVICHNEGNIVPVHAVLHTIVYKIYVPYCFTVQATLSLSYCPQQPERKRSLKDSDGLNNSKGSLCEGSTALQKGCMCYGLNMFAVCRILTIYCMKAIKTLLKCEIRGENHFQKSERKK